MKELELSVQINRTAQDVFNFCLDPKNTPKWVNSIVTEQTNEWPPQVGTIYRNQNKQGIWSEYNVVVLDPPKMFEFKLTSSPYHVRYTLQPLTPDSTELTYFEWMEEGELADPFTPDILQKLKQVLEG